MWNRLKAILADFIQQADLVLLGLCCAATLYGMALIASATRYLNIGGIVRYVGVQGAAMVLGICAYIFMSMLDLERLMRRWKWLVAFNVVFIALLLAKQLEWLREVKRDLKSFPSALMVAGHTIALMGWYVGISGDMGNGLTFFFIFLCMAFVAGFALRWFVLLFAGSGAAIAASVALGLMPDYMINRFRVLFDHSYDTLGAGWQQTRGLLALGSGGLFGQGYMQGTQTQAGEGSLPARHTDFIFCVCGEELGMIGCLVVIALLAAIIIRVLLVARRAETPFHCYVCVGVAAMLIFQTVVNIGMCLFVMPVIGLTLPFFSYGGSSLLTLYAAMGVVSGIKKRSPVVRRPGRPLG